MKDDLYIKFFEGFEEKHWWFVARRRIILDQFNQVAKKLTYKPKILDIGCGTGYTYECLQKYGDVWGVDASEKAIEFCEKRNVKNLYFGEATKIPFGEKEFDIVAMLDVLEHVEEDHKAIDEINRVLKPGGYGIITVPAFKFLWSEHDVDNGHFRRYSAKDLKKLLKAHNFEIKKISYFNFFLFPMVVFVRIIKNLLKKVSGVQSDLVMYPRPVNAILRAIFTFELYLLRFVSLPYGSSIIVTFKKK